MCASSAVFPISLLEIIVSCFFPAGRNVKAWLDSSNKTPFLFLSAPSIFVLLDCSRTRIVESCPDSKSVLSSFIAWGSKLYRNGFIASFLGYLAPYLSVSRMQTSPLVKGTFSVRKRLLIGLIYLFLLLFKCSFIIPIRRSFLPLPMTAYRTFYVL